MLLARLWSSAWDKLLINCSCLCCLIMGLQHGRLAVFDMCPPGLCSNQIVHRNLMALQAALERDIQETLNGWKAHLSAASFILIHAPSANAAALFAGAAPPLSRSDPRVRGIPFATRCGPYHSLICSTMHCCQHQHQLVLVCEPSLNPLGQLVFMSHSTGKFGRCSHIPERDWPCGICMLRLQCSCPSQAA